MESQYFRNSYSNCKLQYVTIPTVTKPARCSPRREVRTLTTWVMLLFRCSLLHLFQFDFFYALPSLFFIHYDLCVVIFSVAYLLLSLFVYSHFSRSVLPLPLFCSIFLSLYIHLPLCLQFFIICFILSLFSFCFS
jgi:hypothetical protein